MHVRSNYNSCRIIYPRETNGSIVPETASSLQQVENVRNQPCQLGKRPILQLVFPLTKLTEQLTPRYGTVL